MREAAAADGDYEMFLQELEGDKEMRTAVNLYKKSAADTTMDGSAGDSGFKTTGKSARSRSNAKASGGGGAARMDEGPSGQF